MIIRNQETTSILDDLLAWKNAEVKPVRESICNPTFVSRNPTNAESVVALFDSSEVSWVSIDQTFMTTLEILGYISPEALSYALPTLLIRSIERDIAESADGGETIDVIEYFLAPRYPSSQAEAQKRSVYDDESARRFRYMTASIPELQRQTIARLVKWFCTNGSADERLVANRALESFWGRYAPDSSHPI